MDIRLSLNEVYDIEPTKENLLAEGGFSKVYWGKSKLSDEKFAIKVIRPQENNYVREGRQDDKKKRTNQIIAYTEDEINTLLLLDSPFVVRLICYQKLEDEYRLVFEFCELDLHRYIVDNMGKLKERHIRFIMKQLVIALDHIHSQNILHRDIKPKNILMKQVTSGLEDSDSRLYRVKIADFGFGKNLENHVAVTNIGTEGYKAPEVEIDGSYSKPSDVYSLGCVFRALLRTVNDVSPQYKELVTQMCLMDPNKRLSTSDILKHPLFLPEATYKELNSIYNVTKKVATLSQQSIVYSHILRILSKQLSEKEYQVEALKDLKDEVYIKYKDIKIGFDYTEDPQIKETNELNVIFKVVKTVLSNIVTGLLDEEKKGIYLDHSKIALEYILKNIEEESLSGEQQYLTDFGSNVYRLEEALEVTLRLSSFEIN